MIFQSSHSLKSSNGSMLTWASNLAPPHARRPRGRPKKNRIRGRDEEGLGKKVSKQKRYHKCTRCKKFGHHKNTCKEPLPPPTQSEMGNATAISLNPSPQPSTASNSRATRGRRASVRASRGRGTSRKGAAMTSNHEELLQQCRTNSQQSSQPTAWDRVSWQGNSSQGASSQGAPHNMPSTQGASSQIPSTKGSSSHTRSGASLGDSNWLNNAWQGASWRMPAPNNSNFVQGTSTFMGRATVGGGDSFVGRSAMEGGASIEGRTTVQGYAGSGGLNAFVSASASANIGQGLHLMQLLMLDQLDLSD